MKAVLAMTVVAVILVPIATAGQKRTLPIKEEQVVTSAVGVEAAQLKKAARQVGELRKLTWSCQDTLISAGALAQRTRAAVDIWSLPRSVPYRAWVAERWSTRAKSCQQRLRERTIPLTGDWSTAVQLVQRVHPGTGPWLMSCSSGEGGHGGWVPNRQGSGADGWMQFMRGTYYAYSGAAFAHARSLGFIIDERANSWYSPLGQALTAAYMRDLGISHVHWKPSIDALCI